MQRPGSAAITELPLEAAGVDPPRDFGSPAGAGAGGAVQVWTWRERVVESERESGDVELRIEPPAGAGPEPSAPWKVRVWGARRGAEPALLQELEFDGARPVEVEISAAELEAHDQVFVLRAAWRLDPPRFLAACARASFDARDQVYECPKDAPRPYQLVAWWGLSQDGDLARRVIELAPGRSQRVEGRYASLFTLQRE